MGHIHVIKSVSPKIDIMGLLHMTSSALFQIWPQCTVEKGVFDHNFFINGGLEFVFNNII